MSSSYILSVDQGTSGTKAIIFNEKGYPVAKGSKNLRSYYPAKSYVEQDPEEIYHNVITAVTECLQNFSTVIPGGMDHLAACGITNQRETFVVWDKNGKPLHNAVVWQCKRSAAICDQLVKDGLEPLVNKKTGLTIDPYFSGTKLIWLYRNNTKVRKAIDGGEAFFGTIDTWLLYKLTHQKAYLTDHTNASRTLLFNIHDLDWDNELLEKFGLDNINLPKVISSANTYGETDFEGLLPHAIPITGLIGDSHAAFFGENCFDPGTAKVTMGTGSSILYNADTSSHFENEGIYQTIGWSLQGKLTYALEGIIVSCGSTLEWLKNNWAIYKDHEELEAMAKSLDSSEGVCLIPAFSGMGAPYWEKEWKGSIHGLTFGTTKAHLVKAALESICFQINDVIQTIKKNQKRPFVEIKADGGMTANRHLMQNLANILQIPVVTVNFPDISAYGAALIAGIGQGLWEFPSNLPEIDSNNIIRYEPAYDDKNLKKAYVIWQKLMKNKRY